MRFLFALWAAKLARFVMRAMRYNGTNYPGELALRICPYFLSRIGKPGTIIAVTGTNGKTTVSNLLCDVLEQSGQKVLNNRAGSNIASGIATSLLTGSTLFGRTKYKIAVLEVDERSSLRIYPYVKPDFIVITNLFRDSIMRNAHPAYIADILTKAIPDTARLIVNADDLISCRIAPDNERVFFGIARMDTDILECENLINDMRICPDCQGELEYDYLRYHHIGRAHCKECGFCSPDYDYCAENVNMTDMTMTVRDRESGCEYRLISDSVFNIYNMVSAVAVLRELGMPHDRIAAYMSDMRIVETRYSVEEVGGVRVVMQMAKEKNALACSRAFDYVAGQEGKKELLLMMNCLGDAENWSENTCWLYDCDFEFLNRDNITRIVVTGPRALDYRLRLMLAGVPEERIVCVSDEFLAVEALSCTPGESIYLFYGADSLALARRVHEKVLGTVREKTSNEN